MNACCPFCSAELPEKAVFCQMCGKKVINSKKCHHCGLENISSAARFCPACGIALTSGFNIKKTGAKACVITDTPFYESELVIPDVVNGLLVTGIKDSAFADNNHIESVEFPDSVKEIGQGAFSNCSKLKKVTITQGVKEIGQGAFAHCPALETAILGDCVTEIKQNAFTHCGELKEIILGDGIKKINSGVFRNCSGDAVITYKEKEYKHEDFWNWKDFLESMGCEF